MQNHITHNILVFPFLFFIAYWYLPGTNRRQQNLLLLSGSYLVYGLLDWRFPLYLFFTSILTFVFAAKLNSVERKRNLSLVFSISLVVAGLMFFKYCNFFIGGTNEFFKLLGLGTQINYLNLVLPLGISFYTFRCISYLVDVDTGKLSPGTSWFEAFVYFSFFPALFAGPIDKAADFIPQVQKQRTFQYSFAAVGVSQILWGLFKKMVVADACAPVSDLIFSTYTEVQGPYLVLGAVVYTIQIYADFSGYSDMAIGYSKLLGFKLNENFDTPFFARSIPEFWRKWHISLSAWFREYVFFPLNIGLRNYGRLGQSLAILFTFVLLGFWHGANFTFIVFGLLHGVFFIPSVWMGDRQNREKQKGLGALRSVMAVFFTFSMVAISFVFFRSTSVEQAIVYLTRMVSGGSGYDLSELLPGANIWIIFGFTLFMLVVEHVQSKELFTKKNLIATGGKAWILMHSLLILILLFFRTDSPEQFIYFQF